MMVSLPPPPWIAVIVAGSFGDGRILLVAIAGVVDRQRLVALAEQDFDDLEAVVGDAAAEVDEVRICALPWLTVRSPPISKPVSARPGLRIV